MSADYLPAARTSVIVPTGRGDLARATVESLLSQTVPPLEIILVGSEAPLFELKGGTRFLPEPDQNPAVRRNRAAAAATGEILAFIDDDAVASSDWLERGIAALRSGDDVLAAGGVDPGPHDAPMGEAVADVLLAARWIGSGVACHERRTKVVRVRHSHDVALVNLFVLRSAFEEAGGFSDRIGYIGEDSELISRLLERGTVLLDPRIEVRHRRRSFPGAFLAQRFRYRRKMGSMLVRRERRWTLPIILLLIAPLIFLGVLVTSPLAGAVLAGFYAAGTLVLGGMAGGLPLYIYPLLPLLFAVHHANYWLGLVAGLLGGFAAHRRGVA